MGENIDVKALRARFAQTQLVGGGPSPRSSAIGHVSDSSANGVVRKKPSPVMPPRQILPMNSPGESKRNIQPPHGVYPRPPPAHRKGAKEESPTPLVQPEPPGRIKHTGELLQNRMLKHHGERTLHTSPRHALPSQRSITEVPPLKKPLPTVGQRPSKPKRPPSVNLDHWRKKTASFQPPVRQQSMASKAPGRPPNKPTMLTQNKSSFSNTNVDHEEETYDDIELPPPPPPPPKMSSRESYTDSFSSVAEDDSDQSEIYEHIDLDEQPPVLERKPKDLKRQQELEKKEQKEKLKKENEYRKKFKLTGDVEVLHMARVREDWQGGKNDLRVRQGESVEIVRVKNNPEGKWLARNLNGEYGYINNRCVDVDYEEVKRKLLLSATPSSFPPPVHEDEEVYDDIGSEHLDSNFTLGGEVYDDVDAIPDEFPLPPPEICSDPKRSKKLEKEEKEFRKKFKFEGPIKVLGCMMVDPNANIKKSGGKDLAVIRGEILEVIEQTNEKRVLCRNTQGKYGYVPRSYLLQEESEIYDDIDNRTDIYDNDASTSGHFRS